MLLARAKLCGLLMLLVCSSGCELPHGPVNWEPVQRGFFNRGHHLGEPLPADCDPDCDAPIEQPATHSHGHRFAAGRMPHHQPVPLAGPEVQAPWPKYHPVPTRPVFEPTEMR